MVFVMFNPKQTKYTPLRCLPRLNIDLIFITSLRVKLAFNFSPFNLLTTKFSSLTPFTEGRLAFEDCLRIPESSSFWIVMIIMGSLTQKELICTLGIVLRGGLAMKSGFGLTTSFVIKWSGTTTITRWTGKKRKK